jgi:dihydroorotase (multifunctional complex type)
MHERFDLVVRGGTVVGAGPTRALDVGIRDGRFAAVAESGTLTADSTDVLDAHGLHVLPGVIDGHVHFREPGLEYKGDWLTESRAAVFGGVTTVLDMPNTVPPTRDVAAARQKVALASAKSYCDFGVFGLIDNQFDKRELTDLIASGLVVGFKVFLGPTTGGISAPDDRQLLAALVIARQAGLRVGFHAEDAHVLSQVASMLGESTNPLSHLEARPASAEVAAIDHAGRLLAQSGAPGHVFHLTSRDGLEAIERWRARGVDLTTEVSAHHVFLARDDYGRVGGLIKVNPPVRGEPHASVLMEALAHGRIDCVGSDHAPHTPGEKLGDDIRDVLSGIAGVETTLPLFLTAVADGRLSLERLADAMSAAPARVWGLREKGRLNIGADADLTLVDLDRSGVLRGADLHGKHHLTPFEGIQTVGAPVATVILGKLIVHEGRLTGQPGLASLVVGYSHERKANPPAGPLT